jgi:hypothetical protein
MKRIFALFLTIIISYSPGVSYCQPAPKIDWLKCIGGSGDDGLRQIIATADGGFAAVGITKSHDGDISTNHDTLTYDGLIIKLNSTGGIQWQKCLGGTGDDDLKAILELPDGGYFVAGSTTSNDGDVTGNHLVHYDDVWVIRLNSIGEILWQRCYGGTNIDFPTSMVRTNTGGIILAGQTSSRDGDITGHNPGEDSSPDGWVLQLDSLGKLIWQHCLGGSEMDRLNGIIQTVDGGFMVSGTTRSNQGDVSGRHGIGLFSDIWVAKLTSMGAIEWQKCLGSSRDDYGWCLIQSSDGGYLIGGSVNSNDGDVSGYSLFSDGWVVKLSSTGVIEWQKCLGSRGDETIQSIIQISDGGFVVSGYTTSIDSEAYGNHGTADAWVVALSPVGEIQWGKCIGGSSGDFATSLVQDHQGFLFAGSTSSDDGNIAGFHKGEQYRGDALIVKLATTSDVNSSNMTESILMFPNPTDRYVTIDNIPADSIHFFLTNVLGQVIMKKDYFQLLSSRLDLSIFPAGIYHATFSGKNFHVTKVIVKK